MRGRRRGLAAVLLAGAAGVAGVTPVLWLTAAPAWAFTAPVKIDERPSQPDEFEFAPTTVSIHVDDKVLWTNRSQEQHTITSDAGAAKFDSGKLGAGQQFEKKFVTAGTYTYHCEIHDGMTGRIEVVDPSAPPPTTTSTAPPPTTTTAPPSTTTTNPPPTTTTTAPGTTTTAPRTPSGDPFPVPTSAPAGPPAPPPTLATSSTTIPTTTSTTAPVTTTSVPPPVEEAPPPPPPPPSEGEAAPPAAEATPPSTEPDDDLSSAMGPRPTGDDDLDPATVAMVSALLAVGAFAAWTLIRVRPGRI